MGLFEKKPSRRKILVAISDTHAGHKLGLCHPDVLLQQMEFGTVKWEKPKLLEVQKFLYDVYAWGIDEIKKLAGDDEIILLHNGDPTHGKAKFLELMTSRMSDQIEIAAKNFEPWCLLPNVKQIYFAIGTGVHEMGEGSASILITSKLQDRHPKVNVNLAYHGLLTVDNFRIDYSHHGSNTGSRKWLEGNELRYYMKSLMMREIMDGETPPQLYLRGHYHTLCREIVTVPTKRGDFQSWGVILPGFTFKDDYTRKATRSEYKQTAGMVAFELVDGKLIDMHKFVQTVDIRTRQIYGH